MITLGIGLTSLVVSRGSSSSGATSNAKTLLDQDGKSITDQNGSKIQAR